MNTIVQGTEGDLVDSQIVVHKGDRIMSASGEIVADKDMTVRDLAELGIPSNQ